MSNLPAVAHQVGSALVPSDGYAGACGGVAGRGQAMGRRRPVAGAGVSNVAVARASQPGLPVPPPPSLPPPPRPGIPTGWYRAVVTGQGVPRALNWVEITSRGRGILHRKSQPDINVYVIATRSTTSGNYAQVSQHPTGYAGNGECWYEWNKQTSGGRGYWNLARCCPDGECSDVGIAIPEEWIPAGAGIGDLTAPVAPVQPVQARIATVAAPVQARVAAVQQAAPAQARIATFQSSIAGRRRRRGVAGASRADAIRLASGRGVAGGSDNPPPFEVFPDYPGNYQRHVAARQVDHRARGGMAGRCGVAGGTNYPPSYPDYPGNPQRRDVARANRARGGMAGFAGHGHHGHNHGGHDEPCCGSCAGGGPCEGCDGAGGCGKSNCACNG